MYYERDHRGIFPVAAFYQYKTKKGQEREAFILFFTLFSVYVNIYPSGVDIPLSRSAHN
jgi:hypothetical protein